jgi:hypothetical protein
MDFFQWIPKQIVQAVTGGLILGLLASSVRAFSLKDTPKAFFIRMYCGGVMAGLTALALCQLPAGFLKMLPIPVEIENIDMVIYGLVIFTAGYYGAEWGAAVAKSSKDKINEALGIDKVNDEKDGTDI